MGDAVELPMLRQTFKIKSLQSFKQDVTAIASGDRAGMCLAQLQASKIERTFVSAPGLLQTVSCCVCIVEKCRFYQGAQCCLCSLTSIPTTCMSGFACLHDQSASFLRQRRVCAALASVTTLSMVVCEA